jgi:hypothetical protein
MNTCLVKSFIFFLSGSLRIGAGHLLGKHQLRVNGYQMLINARCQLAIIEAQRVIQACNKRQQNSFTSVSK